MRFTRHSPRVVYCTLGIALLLSSVLVASIYIRPAKADGKWWNTSWPFRRAITIDHGKVSADLADFPALIDLVDNELANKAQDSGNDIVFADANGAKLDHEIESYDNRTGHLVAWVRVPHVSSIDDTVLYVYYGNHDASNQENPTGVWDSGYVMVQHLEETTSLQNCWQKYTGNPILNSTQNGFASVFYDNDTGTYHLYCSWGSILHFTSSDGKNWARDPNNPVLSGNSEGVPMVWKENGTWYMLYRYGNPLTIGLANSTDAVHWTRYEGNPVLPGDPGKWDDPSYLLDPWGIIKVGSTYYLWYNTIGSVPGLGRCTGLATSTNLINWTKDPHNPIFTGGRFTPSTFKYGEYYYLIIPRYTNFPYGEIELYRDSNPTFYDGEREYLGVAVEHGSPGQWDEARFDTPHVFTDTIYRDTYSASNNELWVYYSGINTTGPYDWWTGITIEKNISEALFEGRLSVSTHLDSTLNHNDGQILGGVNLNATGKIDGADDFDGGDGFVNCGDNNTMKGMNTLTVEAWIKPNRMDGSGIISKLNNWTAGTGGSYSLWQESSGNLGWGVVTETSAASLSDTPPLQSDQWYHIVGVYDGSQIRLYLNGTRVGTPQSITDKIASTNDPCYIGRYSTVYMNGTIDEVRISNVSRSADWVSTEYNNQCSPSTFYTLGEEEAITTKISIDPSLVEKYPVDVGSTFETNVTVQNIIDLFGFDLNLTWDSSLITLTGVDYESSLDNIWGAGNWVMVKNDTAAGWYKLVALSTSSGFSDSGTKPLVRLTFHVDRCRNWEEETSIRFAVMKLSDSYSNPILASVTNGVYRMAAQKPTIQMKPDATICRKYDERFNLSINVVDALDVKDFSFEINCNNTLLDYVEGSDVWSGLGAGTIAFNETSGTLHGSVTFSTPISGERWLLNVTFRASYHRIWRNESLIPDWRNDQTDRIRFNWANLSYLTHADLRYEEGGVNQINVTELVYTFSSIQGDVDNNGTVDVFDLRTVAAYYLIDSSKPEWTEASKYDLNGDNVIDVLDLLVIDANFGYAYDC